MMWITVFSHAYRVISDAEMEPATRLMFNIAKVVYNVIKKLRKVCY